MKSSLAQTFKEIAEGIPSSDRVFPSRTTRRNVTTETGQKLGSSAVLVLPPYDDVFGISEQTATLLVDAKLRKEYEQLYADIERAKARLFEAKHSVTLNADKKIEVTSQEELENVIAEEKSAILEDRELRKTFNAMEKRITKNEMLRDFQEFLAENEQVLALMGNLEKLKEDVWKSYFKMHEDLYNDVISKYQDAAKRTKEIEAEAGKQLTQWEGVIDIFNRRFFVPFKLTVKNKVSVMLGQELVPSLGFTFNEGGESAEMEREDLLEILSNGEKKALYILNVIFEVEVRRRAQQETVFIVDDIADSFDYKNKYAIIQYLKEIADEDCFREILLTHNFDFFRTVNSRFVPYSHCLMVERTQTEITLVPAAGIKNLFLNDWKPNFHVNARKRVAAISFIRNIVEYTRGDDHPHMATLTALLHWKPESETITHGDLDRIYAEVFTVAGGWPQPDTPVLETIEAEALACLT